MKHLAKIAIALAAFVFAINGQAEISYIPSVKTNSGTVLPIITIHGRIVKEDVPQFNLLAEAARLNAKSTGIVDMGDQSAMLIRLDSPGGSVNAAIAIGKAIRALNPFSVTVQNSASCVSACVLLLAGGTTRAVDGQVGIHRPFLDDDYAFTVKGQKQTYAVIEANIKSYLASVNVPISLYDVMFRVPPEQVRYLSHRELQDFNLNEDDPFYKEARDAAQAKRHNLPKSEYQRRISICSKASSENAALECFNRLFEVKQPSVFGYNPDSQTFYSAGRIWSANNLSDVDSYDKAGYFDLDNSGKLPPGYAPVTADYVRKWRKTKGN